MSVQKSRLEKTPILSAAGAVHDAAPDYPLLRGAIRWLQSTQTPTRPMMPTGVTYYIPHKYGLGGLCIPALSLIKPLPLLY